MGTTIVNLEKDESMQQISRMGTTVINMVDNAPDLMSVQSN